MPKQPVGLAIKLTIDNVEKIAVLNGGVVPQVEALVRGTYFIQPYSPDIKASIVPGYIFEENWRFIDAPSDDHFVEIVEI